jgi:uncharacterized protein
MALNIQNKVILITGSTDGLGKLLALELSKLGADVIIHGKDQSKINNVIKEIKSVTGKQSTYINCDFNKPENIKTDFGVIKRLDILINNAGIWEEGNTIDATHEKIISIVNTNLASYLLVTRTLLPILSRSDFGQILNVVSVAGYEVPTDFFHTYYSATKYGLQGFSEALDKEYTNKNVRIMGFYPGGMETDLFRKAGLEYKIHESWMFDPKESVEAIIFMLTRNKKISVKRLDLINHLFV